MAHKKGGGSSRNGRDSNPQFRGVKAFGGQLVNPGGIIVRQVGTVFRAGRNVRMGRDCTLYSLTTGRVRFLSRGRVDVDPVAVAES
jgi:large subunit ribosomal protein L27